MVGAGLGSFGVIHPYFKDRDLSSTTAMSSLLQWSVESGAVGLGILASGCALVPDPAAQRSETGRTDRQFSRSWLDRSGFEL